MQTTKKTTTTTDNSADSSPFLKGEVMAIAPRGIHKDTCKKYSYEIGENEKGQTVHIANYKDSNGKIVGQKIR